MIGLKKKKKRVGGNDKQRQKKYNCSTKIVLRGDEILQSEGP